MYKQKNTIYKPKRIRLFAFIMDNENKLPVDDTS